MQLMGKKTCAEKGRRFCAGDNETQAFYFLLDEVPASRTISLLESVSPCALQFPPGDLSLAAGVAVALGREQP